MLRLHLDELRLAGVLDLEARAERRRNRKSAGASGCLRIQGHSAAAPGRSRTHRHGQPGIVECVPDKRAPRAVDVRVLLAEYERDFAFTLQIAVFYFDEGVV